MFAANASAEADRALGGNALNYRIVQQPFFADAVSAAAAAAAADSAVPATAVAGAPPLPCTAFTGRVGWLLGSGPDA